MKLSVIRFRTTSSYKHREIVFMMLLFVVVCCLSSCTVTSHRTQIGSMGEACSQNWPKVLEQKVGPIELETIISGSWYVPREGLIKVDHLNNQWLSQTDEDELVNITFHVLHHPDHGTYLINTGLESAWSSKNGDPKVNWIIEHYLHSDHQVKVKTSISSWLQSHESIQGVLLTHMHLYTLLGLPEVPSLIPIYVGPGETDYNLGFSALALRGNYNSLLEPFQDLQIWDYRSCGDEFEGVIDVFQDGSLFALWLPGYSPGNTVYLARTHEGLVLVTGDTAHTAQSWQLDIPPGSFAYDMDKAEDSFHKLKSFVSNYPDIKVYPNVNFK